MPQWLPGGRAIPDTGLLHHHQRKLVADLTATKDRRLWRAAAISVDQPGLPSASGSNASATSLFVPARTQIILRKEATATPQANALNVRCLCSYRASTHPWQQSCRPFITNGKRSEETGLCTHRILLLDRRLQAIREHPGQLLAARQQ